MTPFNPHYSEAPQATDTLASAACKTTQARLFTNQCAIAPSATRSTRATLEKKKFHIAVNPFSSPFVLPGSLTEIFWPVFLLPGRPCPTSHLIHLFLFSFYRSPFIYVLFSSSPLLFPLSRTLCRLRGLTRRPREGLAFWTPMKAEGEDLAAGTHPPLSCRCGL